MPNSNTKIQFKRSDLTKSVLSQREEPLSFGEPLFIEVDNTSNKHKYLAIGNEGVNNNIPKVGDATYFEGIINPDYLGQTVYADPTTNTTILQNGSIVGSQRLNPTPLTIPTTTNTKYYLVSYANIDDTQPNIFIHDTNYESSTSRGIYITNNGVLVGSAWNDYAEKRKCISGLPGQVVCENGYGELELSSYKLQPLPYVISDTHGICIGLEGEQYKPVAVAGRVLVYTNEKELKVGDVMCAGKNGYAEKMTRQEIINYPDRILGIVSEIPTQAIWNDVEINGRIWITIK